MLSGPGKDVGSYPLSPSSRARLLRVVYAASQETEVQVI